MSAVDKNKTKRGLGCYSECESCKREDEDRPGRGVKLFGQIRLTAATDDFVIFGYVQCFGRTIPLLLLGIVLFMLHDKSTRIETDDKHSQHFDLKSASLLAVISLIVVSFPLHLVIILLSV